MKKILGMLVFVLLFSAGIAVAEVSEELGGVLVGFASGSATVQDIDYITREITLMFDDGNTEAFTAGPEVRNFNQINKGDKINLDYAATAVLSIGGPAQPLARKETVEIKGAPLGQKPEGTIEKITDVSATIENVDYANRLVTVQGPQRALTVKINPEEDLQKIKKGDQVIIHITQVLTIKVTPQPEGAIQK